MYDELHWQSDNVTSIRYDFNIIENTIIHALNNYAWIFEYGK